MPQNHHRGRQDGHEFQVQHQQHAVQHQIRNGDHHHGENLADNMNPRFAYCCVPTGCHRMKDEPIDPHDPADAVKVICNNENCAVGEWMHGTCFGEWEQHVLSYLRSCGRARSWSEKQRLQNLWTKKGYDLAYKACDCRCGKGHLRKDNDYIAPARQAGKQRKHKKRNEKALPTLQQKGSGHNQSLVAGNHLRSFSVSAAIAISIAHQHETFLLNLQKIFLSFHILHDVLCN